MMRLARMIVVDPNSPQSTARIATVSMVNLTEYKSSYMIVRYTGVETSYMSTLST